MSETPNEDALTQEGEDVNKVGPADVTEGEDAAPVPADHMTGAPDKVETQDTEPDEGWAEDETDEGKGDE